jgi:hypothetical protein
MTRYYARIQSWPVHLDAPSLSKLRATARQYANEMELGNIKLVDVTKIEERETKLKSIKVSL